MKTKNKKTPHAGKKTGPKPQNPFEIRFNKVKHQVLGKTSKDGIGKRNENKLKGIDARKSSLLKEYKNKNKTNSLRDKRLGEYDASVSLEDKMLARFAKERGKNDKKTRFNLNDDDDELTHLGQSVADLQEMKDAPVDSDLDDDGDEDFGRLGSEHVEKLHFGGGDPNASAQSTGGKKHADIIEEIIAKSKQMKYQRKVEKDQAEEMTDKLDEDWKSLAGMLGGPRPVKKSEDRKTLEKGKADDYDVLVRELMFEKKGVATDRLKTEEEIAKEELEELAALESQRLMRMRGDSSAKMDLDNHRSADDLDDGFILDGDEKRKKVEFTLTYKDGKAVSVNSEEQEIENENEDDETHADDSESDEDEYMDDENDDLSDIEDSEDDHEEDNLEVSAEKKPTSRGILKKSSADEIPSQKTEIPYTFSMPTSLSELQHQLRPYEFHEQLIVIERIKKCHHPSLAEGNKDKLIELFELLLRCFLDACNLSPLPMEFLDGLTLHLYSLLRIDHGETGKHVTRLLISCRDSQNWKKPAPVSTCLLLKLVSVLYPTSDLSHPVVTPAFLLLCDLLQRISLNSFAVVASGLILSQVALDYVRFAKRLAPEALNFLHGVLYLGHSGEVDLAMVTPPCRPVGKHSQILTIDAETTEDFSSLTVEGAVEAVRGFTRKNEPLPTSSKLSALSAAARLLREFARLYNDAPAARSLFQRTRYFISKLSVDLFPTSLREDFDSLSADCEFVKRVRRLRRAKPRPKPLPQFEPKFEMEFDGRKRFAGDQKTKERKRLERQYKEEYRSASKDLRQDALFLANVKIADQLAKDKKRSEKVREIYSHLSSQEGEHRKMERMKKKK